MNEVNKDKLSQLLIRLRNSRDISRNDMGRLLGVSGATVKRWERKESMFIVTSITAFKPVGDISGVRVDIQDSNIFSEEDFSKAVEVIKSNFKRNGRGCQLLKIKYIGDSANESVGCKSVVERYNLRKYIVFEITREVSNRFFQSDLSGVHDHYNLWIGTKDGYNWAIIDGGGV